jgi:hypothetical protein
MKYQTGTTLIAAALFSAANVAADPAMSVVTVHTEDPMGYMQWASESGPAIGEAIDAGLGGVCLALAGFYSPGEIYYWHIFEDHAKAMSASIYDEGVTSEAAKLTAPRRISGADLYSVSMVNPSDFAVGDTFANWNILVATDEPALYMQQLAAILGAAEANGYGDITMSAYSALTGDIAGDILVAVGAPNSARLGDFLDQMNSAWMAPMMNNLAGIRDYQHGTAMECTVVHAGD